MLLNVRYVFFRHSGRMDFFIVRMWNGFSVHVGRLSAQSSHPGQRPPSWSRWWTPLCTGVCFRRGGQRILHVLFLHPSFRRPLKNFCLNSNGGKTWTKTYSRSCSITGFAGFHFDYLSDVQTSITHSILQFSRGVMAGAGVVHLVSGWAWRMCYLARASPLGSVVCAFYEGNSPRAYRWVSRMRRGYCILSSAKDLLFFSI